VRVLHVFEPPEGGVPEHVRRLASGLRERGHEAVVAGPPDALVRGAVEAGGGRYEPLPIQGRMGALRDDARTVRRLRRIVRGGAFDVVHVHGQKAGFLGRLAARGSGVPVVYSPHFFVYRTQEHRPRRGQRPRTALLRGIERLLGRSTDAIIAVAEEERESAIADRIAPPERIATIYSGVDLPAGTPAPDPRLAAFRDGGEEPLFGMVAALRDQKGLPTLLDALDRLAARGAPLRFAIVGNGPLDTMVDERVGTAPLAATTIRLPFEGPVDRYLSALDGFVLPSYWEGLPIAVLEAMAAGLPVIATAVNGTPEAVEDGRTGYLVPPYDAAALADAIERLARDPRAPELGRAGRAVVEDRFRMEQMIDNVARLYAAVLDGAEPASATRTG
jgi:glycosyltransferase involved in cell wall biosynthesis